MNNVMKHESKYGDNVHSIIVKYTITLVCSLNGGGYLSV